MQRRHDTRSRSWPIILALAMYLSPTLVSAKVFYELPPLPGAEASYGASINASGAAVGRSRDSNVDTPTIWLPTAGGYVAAALPTLPGLPTGGANSINAAGVIAGYLQPEAADEVTPVAWVPGPGGVYGPPTPLPVPLGTTLSASYAIGAGGAVAGFGSGPTQLTRALVWLAGPADTYPATTILPALSHTKESVATAANADGDIAGYVLTTTNRLDGAVWLRQPDDSFIAHRVIAASDVVLAAMNHYGTGAGVYDGDLPLVMVYFENEFYASNLHLPVGLSEGATNAVNDHHALVG